MKRPAAIRILAWAVWFSVVVLIADQSTAGALENQLLCDVADGQLDAHPLLEAALIAGGMEDSAALRRYRQQFEQHCRSMSDLLSENLPPSQRAQRLHFAMHDQILTGNYQAGSTDVAACFDRGDFNCVSATIVFQSLAARFNVPVTASAARGHVWIRLLGPSPLEIETTCPTWFSSLESNDSAAASDRRGAVPRTIGEVALVGKIYYNRGVQGLEQDHCEAAIAFFEIAKRLDPTDRQAHENLLAALNNGALSLADQGRYAESIAWILKGLAVDDQYSPLLANDLHIHQLWVRALRNSGRWTEAHTIAATALARRPDVPLFQQLAEATPSAFAEE